MFFSGSFESFTGLIGARAGDAREFKNVATGVHPFKKCLLGQLQGFGDFFPTAVLVGVDVRSECKAVGGNEELISIAPAQFKQAAREFGECKRTLAANLVLHSGAMLRLDDIPTEVVCRFQVVVYECGFVGHLLRKSFSGLSSEISRVWSPDCFNPVEGPNRHNLTRQIMPSITMLPHPVLVCSLKRIGNNRHTLHDTRHNNPPI